MRIKTIASLALILLFSYCGLSAQKKGSFDDNITFLGASRKLSCYVPANYDSTVKYRLIICLHGLGDNCGNYRNALVSYGWPGSITNTIFICPESGANGGDYYQPAGDEAVIDKSIAYAESHYHIDSADIILQGFSIGGRDALRYGLDHPKQFKGLLLNTPAVQGVKEALNGHASNFGFTYANAAQVPMYITHGTADPLYAGAIDTAFKKLVLNDGKVIYKEFAGLGHAIPALTGIIDFLSFFNEPAHPGHDADIQGINVPRQTCTAAVPAAVLVRNTGTETLSGITLQYTVNNISKTASWTGTLAPYQHTWVPLPALNAASGEQTLDVKIQYLNNTITDSDTVANERRAAFNVSTQGMALPLLERFNGPKVTPANWVLRTIGDSYDDWFLDSTTHVTGNFAAVGALNTILLFDNAGMVSDLETPVIDLSSVSNPGLKFQVAYNYHHYTAGVLGVDSAFADTLQILISTDCGGSWASLYKKGGKQLATFHDPILNPLSLQACAITPRDSNWRLEEIPLSAYATAKDAIIRFRYISALGGSIYLDNFALSTYLGINTPETVSARIYPNPATGQVNIETGHSDISKVEVQTLDGKTMMTIQTPGFGNTVTVNTSSLARGLYFFKVYTKQGTAIEKVVMN